MTKINATEQKVLSFLADEYSDDYGIHCFASIMSGAGVADRKAVRRACRSLARKGLTRFVQCCWTDEGDPRGAGYGATKDGVAAIYGSR